VLNLMNKELDLMSKALDLMSKALGLMSKALDLIAGTMKFAPMQRNQMIGPDSCRLADSCLEAPDRSNSARSRTE